MLILQTSDLTGGLFFLGDGMDDRLNQRKAAKRALLQIAAEEKSQRETALKQKNKGWKTELEKKIPSKVYEGLVRTFSTGFSLVFRQGRKLIEMTYDKQFIQEQHKTRHDAVMQGRGRQQLRQMEKTIGRKNNVNLTATTAEGIALGIFGVGMPDIVLFLSTMLKGIHETALSYGFEYESAEAQYLILAMMRTSLAKGSEWERSDREVERLFSDMPSVSEEMLKESIHKTARVFAVDMLLLKFIQGMPVVGFLGGAANSVYYRKVMDYVQLKYRKYYFIKQL